MDEGQSSQIATTVCGSEIREPEKYPSAQYKGKVVYFCTGACLGAFEGDPDRFISGEIEHPDDDDE